MSGRVGVGKLHWGKSSRLTHKGFPQKPSSNQPAAPQEFQRSTRSSAAQSSTPFASSFPTHLSMVSGERFFPSYSTAHKRGVGRDGKEAVFIALSLSYSLSSTT